MEHRSSFGGFETRLLELEGSGPPIVFFHGYADSADTWRYMLASLASSGQRAVAVDLPGFGTASSLKAGKILPQLERFGAAVVNEYGSEYGDAVVVGNSLGGALSLRLSAQQDLPLSKIVPIAPAGLDHPRWFELVERERLLAALLSTPFPLPESVVRSIVGEVYKRLAFADASLIDEHVVNTFTSHHKSRQAVLSYIDLAHRMIAELHHPFQFSKVNLPVMVVWGDRDRMVYSSGAEVLVDALPQTRVELLAGCGHCPQVEAPDRVSELLLDFTGHTSAL